MGRAVWVGVAGIGVIGEGLGEGMWVGDDMLGLQAARITRQTTNWMYRLFRMHAWVFRLDEESVGMIIPHSRVHESHRSQAGRIPGVMATVNAGQDQAGALYRFYPLDR